MIVTIVSPERTLFEGQATGVKLPGALGSFEVLEGHAPLVSTLNAGRIVCVGGESDFQIDIAGGFVEVARGRVSVCVETA